MLCGRGQRTLAGMSYTWPSACRVFVERYWWRTDYCSVGDEEVAQYQHQSGRHSRSFVILPIHEDGSN
jgi:hypothetical protein